MNKESRRNAVPEMHSTPWSRFKEIIADCFGYESTPGILLILGVIIALILANSPFAEAYHHFWEYEISLSINEFHLHQSLHEFVNDGLMAIFFFTVGLEIKREVMVGELSTWRKAVLPVVCALGGMVFPAAFYALVNLGGPAVNGWGVPMATDIAFALVIIGLLGSRVPVALKVFVTALAVADDLGAVLVIAFFYTDEVVVESLLFAFGTFAVLIVSNRLGVRNSWYYGILGILGIWIGFWFSGVHATIAGVLTAMAIPVNVRLDTGEFLHRLTVQRDRFETACLTDTDNFMVSEEQMEILEEIERDSNATISPLQRIEHVLEPPVDYLILPLFAMANAGVTISGNFGDALFSTVSLGIIAGLCLGKLVGITGTAWLVTRLGLAELPEQTNWKQLAAAASLAGIGFTMSLFIAELAFTEEQFLMQAKVGVLVASLISATAGVLMFRYWSPATPPSEEEALEANLEATE